ncbi:MAG: SPOR domain-containing protein [Gammaproteobacteria bacterium]|jgi:DedD protein|uniref:SPOR domain-containing protein n=1 Tax=Stutzerimonas xanthomarina TaxID=271420 RepID=UPI00190B12B5|nr:SPOR domain-containing protein [Stutzerimonas xanthomarina]MBU0522954.1 SPOR domain-containing protein [Gammaproteobacteria bacterium]MBK3848521.1 SPOR domain-containing protein [Stutzerimonas xanthomarina]MBU0812006.1 SPOR domain-containing protein [Gammaproteobacteria bacterium]MBU0853058.1 SPOR domain-containing protein [Gammaproteobacteria bacterium]MBU1302336.1 SPOR domain-containing protein [Gammaproteobacteria bacterium]|tara:strand:+ start:629 stop:1258 length:630 start_codon:yes stop_codon:yes gene_type:complete
MLLVDRRLLQRIVGALVLVALAVIFVPMLFNRDDAGQQIAVDAPAMPETPAAPIIETQPVEVPEPAVEAIPEDYEIIEEDSVAESSIPANPIDPVPAEAQPAPEASEQAVTAAPPLMPENAEEQRLDTANLPVSWSVQLASLSSRENAEKLQKTLRSQGYNAYIRTADGMNRVFVGPLVERAEANRLRDQLQRQHKLDGFVVRFKPEQR